MKKKNLSFLVYLTPFILTNVALAAGGGGIDKVNDFMQNLSTALYGIGAVVLTIAFMWAGFKVMFQGQTLREVAPVFIGGVIVGSASAIAAYIIS
ncbi:TrbC/VirB2 family protein [Campylobacter magnus]|uniref:TrbC/VirB2 family protein n=1 Tax=Campylobacter magnus TaxID=3026462 RepID=UPI0023610FF5|nr:TrbC/VirB2 family protein [Campylobacter magnus]MDD0855528.1 TrbC/VirB2 family protein [Campylobacter magnus]